MAANVVFIDGEAKLAGSRDPSNGQTYFPARALVADGSLRPCESINLSPTGILASWTRLVDRHFGQVDLPEGVRVQTLLSDGPHEIGASYRLQVADKDGTMEWSFTRKP